MHLPAMARRALTALLLGAALVLVTTVPAWAGDDDADGPDKDSTTGKMHVVVRRPSPTGATEVKVLRLEDGTWVPHEAGTIEIEVERLLAPHATTEFGHVTLGDAPRAKSPLSSILRWLTTEGAGAHAKGDPMQAWFDGGANVPMAGLRDALKADGWNAHSLRGWFLQHLASSMAQIHAPAPHPAHVSTRGPWFRAGHHACECDRGPRRRGCDCEGHGCRAHGGRHHDGCGHRNGHSSHGRRCDGGGCGSCDKRGSCGSCRSSCHDGGRRSGCGSCNQRSPCGSCDKRGSCGSCRSSCNSCDKRSGCRSCNQRMGCGSCDKRGSCSSRGCGSCDKGRGCGSCDKRSGCGSCDKRGSCGSQGCASCGKRSGCGSCDKQGGMTLVEGSGEDYRAILHAVLGEATKPGSTRVVVEDLEMLPPDLLDQIPPSVLQAAMKELRGLGLGELLEPGKRGCGGSCDDCPSKGDCKDGAAKAAGEEDCCGTCKGDCKDCPKAKSGECKGDCKDCPEKAAAK